MFAGVLDGFLSEELGRCRVVAAVPDEFGTAVSATPPYVTEMPVGRDPSNASETTRSR